MPPLRIREHLDFIEDVSSRALQILRLIHSRPSNLKKPFITDLQGHVADALLQTHGDYGHMVAYPTTPAHVDARIQRSCGAANEIMKEVIVRSLVGR